MTPVVRNRPWTAPPGLQRGEISTGVVVVQLQSPPPTRRWQNARTFKPDMPGCLLTVGNRSWLLAGMQADGERKSTGGKPTTTLPVLPPSLAAPPPTLWPVEHSPTRCVSRAGYKQERPAVTGHDRIKPHTKLIDWKELESVMDS